MRSLRKAGGRTDGSGPDAGGGRGLCGAAEAAADPGRGDARDRPGETERPAGVLAGEQEPGPDPGDQRTAAEASGGAEADAGEAARGVRRDRR